jgi:hypothetical protein
MSDAENGHLTAADRRSAILGRAGQLEERATTMPGPDGPVDILVREMTGKQAKDFEMAAARGAADLGGYMLQISIVDPDTHELIFEPADRANLEALGITGLNPVLKLIQSLNGMTEEDVEKARQSLLRAPSTATT